MGYIMEKENSYKDAAQHYEQVMNIDMKQKYQNHVEMKIKHNAIFIS